MHQVNVVPEWKKIALVLTVLAVAAIAGTWANSAVFSQKSVAPAAAGAPPISPFDMMRNRLGDLPVDSYEDIF